MRTFHSFVGQRRQCAQIALKLNLTILLASAMIINVAVITSPATARGAITATPIRATPTAPRTAPTPTATPTPTPLPDAVVAARVLTLRDGPDNKYPALEPALRRGQPLEVIGRYRDCAWLQVRASASITGWAPGIAKSVKLNVPCGDIAPGTFRPLTGMIIKDNRKSIRSVEREGELRVHNGTREDGVVALVYPDTPKKPIVAFSVRTMYTFTLKTIPDGMYQLTFTTGEGWDSERGRFTQNESYTRFEDLFPFVTTDVTRTIWSVTLHPVITGTAAIDLIDEDEFPDLGEP